MAESYGAGKNRLIREQQSEMRIKDRQRKAIESIATRLLALMEREFNEMDTERYNKLERAYSILIEAK